MISSRFVAVVISFLVAVGGMSVVQATGAPGDDTPGTAAPAAAAPADPTPLPIALVNALNKLSDGQHKGFRANHAKGLMVEGTFTPSPFAASFSKAPHFLKSVPVSVRFSDATGVPTMPDADPNASPHGIAIRFMLPNGGSTDVVSISANAFPVATPEDFLAFLQAAGASGPTAPKPTPIEKFLSTHPAAVKFVTTPRPAPVSFATLAFYGVNAFKFTNAKGGESLCALSDHSQRRRAGAPGRRCQEGRPKLFDGRIAGADGQGTGEVSIAGPGGRGG